MELLKKISLVLTIIGSLIWGIIGIFNFNILNFIFNFNLFIPRIIYILVGISGIINLTILFEPKK